MPENNVASFSNNLPYPFEEIQKATPGQFSVQEKDYKDVEAEIRKCVGKILIVTTQEGILLLVVTGEMEKA